MNKVLRKFALPLTTAFVAVAANGASPLPAFEEDWRFLKSDAPGAEKPDFDDSKWCVLDLPHDWSIEGPFAATNKTGGAGGFLPGVGWYRKHFQIPTNVMSGRFFVEFDGVMANSDVWINGKHLGKRPYGYVSFRYELTDDLLFGVSKSNVLAVRADNSQQPASRWYAGTGIYRHARLIMAGPVHLDAWSTFITTPTVTSTSATVRVQCTVTNQSPESREITVQTILQGPDGHTVIHARTPPQKLMPCSGTNFVQELIVPSPRRWDLAQPNLYRAIVQVHAGKDLLDVETTPFGIREFKFDPETGFWLNGKNFKLYGVCLHHDGSAFGAAVPLGVWEHRLNALRELGCNAIRTAHNPPSPEFLDLCDRMGFLVMDEFFDCWTVRKNPYDYHLSFKEWSKIDARDTIRRDRNHPSVILWSVGNEIHDTPREELAKGILKGLVEVCHENDPTRPVTQALFRPNVSHDYDNGLADMLDVIGTNYRDTELLAAQRAKPGRKIVGTEQRHERQTWLNLRDNPSHSGQFLWTGVDYLGETRRWPLVGHASGLVDRTGEIKPMAFERQSWWSDKPMVRAVRRLAPNDRLPTDPGYGGEERNTQVQFADWTPRNPAPHDENVEVYSNCEEVELFLNDKSLGSKPINSNASPRNWKVPFEPGTLKAVAKNKGQVVAADALATAGTPVKVVLKASRDKLAPTWEDVSYLRASVVDENGVIVPSATNMINFKISGPGRIAAVDSADNSSHEPFQASERRAFQGVSFAIVRATGGDGPIRVSASTPGLETGTANIETTGGK